MALSFKKIFGGNTVQNENLVNIVGTSPSGQAIIASKVDWKHEGIQDAGASKGDVNAFQAGFTANFARIKNSQELDTNLQQQMKNQIGAEIDQLNANLSTEKGKLDVANQRLESAKLAVDDKRQEIAKVRNGETSIDRTNKLNFWIGLVIIAVMTVYLFLFYSSTAYSAFFRNFDVGESIQEAMFDGGAIQKAFAAGLFEGCFILFLPIIFLGLGFVAYNIGVTAKGIEKYAKTILLYILTFAFDFLLAYKISKAFYDIEALLSEVKMPPFTISVAFTNMDFWIVIFCGFVSYVIWGLVFGFVMRCHSQLTNNKSTLLNLTQELGRLTETHSKAQSAVTQLQQSVNQIEANIKQKERDRDAKIRYDFDAMRQHLADYYHGWVAYFSLCDQEATQLLAIYDREITSVEKWMNKE